MKKRLWIYASLVCASLFLTVCAADRADAATNYNHCIVYNDASCVGMDTNAKAVTDVQRGNAVPVISGRAGEGKAAVAVDVNNICRWINNATGNTATDVFVPFQTDREWTAFASVGDAGVDLKSMVDLARCARPSTVRIPANDPAASDTTSLCYNRSGALSTDTIAYAQPSYGHVGDIKTVAPASSVFSCYTSLGQGPWSKTVVSVKMQGYSADRNGGSTESRANSDWAATAVTYYAPPVNGVCGSSVNGQTLSSAPTTSSLCNTGIPSAVSSSSSSSYTVSSSGAYSGDGTLTSTTRWSWTCSGYNGGTSASCSATKGGKVCYAYTSIQDGMDYQGWVKNRCYMNQSYYVSQGCTTIVCTGSTYSPVKVNLTSGDAKMNSTTKTAFRLTLQDGRILEGRVTGGLNPDEGWLMVRRSNDVLIYDDGTINADNWFGDRDRRSKNGYTDLAETFEAFIEQDAYGERYIPLRQLSKDEKLMKSAEYNQNPMVITDPSFDLRIIDYSGREYYASDIFERVYVDNREDDEADTPANGALTNLILERSSVRTWSGETHSSVDQWFRLDMDEDYSPANKAHPPKSKVLPAPQ